MNTESLWLKTASPAGFPRLDSDLRTDVLVVGGGIAGLTAAYLLLKARKSVVLLERERLGRGETGHTTAHVTYVTDTRLSELVKRFGRDHAQAAWEAGVSAMEQIQAIVEEEGIECELTSVPSFLVAAAGKDLASETEQLREDVRHAEELGFDVSFVESAPLLARPAMRVANQLKFHPAKYLAGLAEKVKAMGGMIFEESEVTDFQDNPRLAKARGQTIQFEHVVIATHVPLQGLRTMVDATLLQSKLALYSTYAIGATVPKDSVAEMLWWDTADPYLYLRVEKGGVHDYVILGGEDHKTGQETDTELPYRRLTESLSYLIPEALPQDRWSSRVIETVDGLPYIGSIGEGQFLGTGFAGNGMTFGTLTGMMACDAITGRRNPWSELFAVERKTLSASMDYMAENKDYPYYLVKGRLTGGEAGRAEDLKPGEGKVLRTKEGKVAAHRDDRGVVHMRSAVCPHMGCIVNWNAAEKTWDCPCHGSRFHADGRVMGGPAESSLAPCKGHE